MRVDYHVHTELCGHARGTVDELVRAAIERGFDEVGIADHLPLTYADDPGLAMAPEQLPAYVEEVLAAKERYAGSIVVRLGIEGDYYAPTMDRIAPLLEAHPYDYVIGSVHALEGWIFDDPRTLERYEGLDLDAFYLDYFSAVTEMVDTGLYDIIGHADLAKKFDFRPSHDLTPLYRRLLERVKQAGMCFEVNTAGLRWPAREIYPEPAFVSTGAALGVPVTMGSDAHSPEDIGRDFDLALALLRESGYSEMAVFEGRARRTVPLP